MVPSNMFVWGIYMSVQVKKETAIDAVETAIRYIENCGANQTMKGLPHPQQLLLDKLDQALIFLDSSPENPYYSDDYEGPKNLTL